MFYSGLKPTGATGTRRHALGLRVKGVLRFFEANECDRDHTTCSEAAEEGNLEGLQWA